MKYTYSRLLFSVCVLFLSARTANADSLKITSNPSGATVEIDGVVVGTTPYEMKALEATFTSHVLSLALDLTSHGSPHQQK